MAHQRMARDLVADPAHGPLPLLMLGLTVVTGIVDAVSIIALGRVFVANMTGNIVFIGFAVAGAAGFSLAASLLGVVGFLVGAGTGGRLIGRFGSDRARLVTAAVALEFVLFAVATVVVAQSAQPVPAGTRDLAVVVLAVATGVQNAIARRLAVPDLTTTVLTMTLTGLAADVRSGLHNTAFARRLLAVATMLGGAVLGAELVLNDNPATALGVGTALLAIIATAAWQTTRHPAPWRTTTTPTPAAPAANERGTR
ncbi:MAG TPA: YoaK family protein [Jatrophihabitantaceae bacterium]|nr:YoaK family protein [Jatrophihabitantaceae bacterium]